MNATASSAAASAQMSFQLIELSRRSSRDASRFLRMPYAIYRDDANWVAPLLGDLKTVFHDGNPLWQHAEMQLWVCVRDGRDVGRIAGIIDRTHNETHAEQTAFFGFFECIDDQGVADALFDVVRRWAAGRGMTQLLGPMNPTTNDECGLLIDGFERPPVFMMTYNPRYYVGLFERAGFTKAKDLLALLFVVDAKPLERLGRLADGVRRREKELAVRLMRKRTLEAELAKVKEVYNAAWEQNWGFVPMTDAEMSFMAKRLRPVMVEEWSLIAEVGGKPVAFMLSLPDMNEAIQPLRGRLLSWRLPRFLRYLFGWKVTKIARVVTMGVTSEFRGRGIEAVMLADSLRHGLKIGTRECEISWVLEDNTALLRLAEVFGAKEYKRYRLYRGEVGQGGNDQ